MRIKKIPFSAEQEADEAKLETNEVSGALIVITVVGSNSSSKPSGSANIAEPSYFSL